MRNHVADRPQLPVSTVWQECTTPNASAELRASVVIVSRRRPLGIYITCERRESALPRSCI
jgi:hypothetical protein